MNSRTLENETRMSFLVFLEICVQQPAKYKCNCNKSFICLRFTIVLEHQWRIRGGRCERHTPPSAPKISSFSISFRENWSNSMLAPPSRVGTLGNSWMRHCISHYNLLTFIIQQNFQTIHQYKNKAQCGPCTFLDGGEGGGGLRCWS